MNTPLIGTYTDMMYLVKDFRLHGKHWWDGSKCGGFWAISARERHI